jgi:hypothetical protein
LVRRWRRFYGTHPLHLLALLACFGLTGYAALQASRGPLPGRMLLWFVGAVIAHDLLLYPLYALADWSVAAVLHGRRAASSIEGPAVINYVRVPALVSGLLLLMFWPLITRHAEPSYRVASGLGTSVFLGRWLLLSGTAFLLSAVAYALRVRRRRRSRRLTP